MKIKISDKDFDYDAFKYFIVNEFPRVRFWEISKNIILAEKNPFVGAYIIIKKKNIRIFGAFPGIKRNLLAMFIILIGGIIVPLAIYFLLFNSKQISFSTAVSETIAKKYSSIKLLNKTRYK